MKTYIVSYIEDNKITSEIVTARSLKEIENRFENIYEIRKI